MFSLTKVLSLGLLALSGASSVNAAPNQADYTGVSGPIATFEVSVTIFSSPGVPVVCTPNTGAGVAPNHCSGAALIYTIDTSSKQTNVVQFDAAGISLMETADHASSKATLSINSAGTIELHFPAEPNVGIFDDAEISFTSSASDGSAVFFPNDGTAFGEAESMIVSSALPKSSCGAYKAGTSKPTYPSITVDDAGKVKVNIHPGSVSTVCDIDYIYSSNPEQPIGGCTPGSQGCANGDPQFTGFLGQSYQVHGASGTVYNVISTPSFQFNALFSYLESGACRAGTMCFGHPGNYFGEVGMLLKDAGKTSRVHVVAGPVNVGLKVLVDGAELPISSNAVSIGSSSVTVSQFDAVVETPEFSLRLQNSDMFLNQDISVNSGLLSEIRSFKQAHKAGNATEEAVAALPHGLLGQSWQMKTYPNRWKYIQGGLFDYAVADGVFGTEFRYNRF